MFAIGQLVTVEIPDLSAPGFSCPAQTVTGVVESIEDLHVADDGFETLYVRTQDGGLHQVSAEWVAEGVRCDWCSTHGVVDCNHMGM